MQNLGFLVDQSFDLVVSYLNQSDPPDFMANTREVHRILRSKSRFIIANLHPMRPDGVKQKMEQKSMKSITQKKIYSNEYFFIC